ncbi:hypothetical protein [Streptomyces sp. NPDC050560]|uniref:hypothetical protein n=1 Tax=Streptomyces sp. NPDC050560 TaxID=3365630 RepID=UPI0037AB4132
MPWTREVNAKRLRGALFSTVQAQAAFNARAEAAQDYVKICAIGSPRTPKLAGQRFALFRKILWPKTTD